MLTDAAIIGGTGIDQVLGGLGGTSIHIPTPAGQLSGTLFPHDSGPVLLISRHSEGHRVPPHLVNYKAMALGLQKAGVSQCFGTAAVGSLRKDWGVGTMAVLSDFVDNAGRALTLFDREVVHTDFSEPFSVVGRRALIEAAASQGVVLEPEGVYVCENGPRYETPHQVKLLASQGDVVGMTAATEAILLKEAGVGYTCLALVTNLAAGLSEGPLEHGEVTREMGARAKTAVELLLGAIDRVRRS